MPRDGLQQLGCKGESILLRRELTSTSSAPGLTSLASAPDASIRNAWRTTRGDFCANNSTSRNSVRVSSMLVPCRVTLCCIRSTTMICNRQKYGRRFRGGTGNRTKPGQQFGKREGLGQIVVGAKVKPANDLVFFVVGSQHENRSRDSFLSRSTCATSYPLRSGSPTSSRITSNT